MKNKRNKDIEIIETSDNIQTEAEVNSLLQDEEAAAKKEKKAKKARDRKIRNDYLLAHGSYSIIITAVVLVALIVLNVFVYALSDRFHLDFDMTSDKKNSISKENIEYIKTIDTPIEITVFSPKESFYSYATQGYGLTADSDYFTQAAELIEKYQDYNKNINVTFLDPQSSEYTAFVKNYSTITFSPCDVLISSEVNNNERYKLLKITDLFNISESQSSYYYTTQTVTSSKVETAVTSALDYVTNAETKSIALLTGHSTKDYATAYTETLERNNYDVTVISDTIISSISNEYDTIAIVSPTVDFGETEITAISDFLDNDGKLGKGLVYFADATCPQLPNLNSFLQQWGIAFEDGILFETSSQNHIANTPTALGLFPAELEDDTLLTSQIGTSGLAITDCNVPMTTCTPASTDITTSILVESSPYTVVAPVGAESTWADYTDADKGTRAGVVQSVQAKWENDDESDENNHLKSYIMAFSSVEFIESEYAQMYSNYNEEITVLCTGRASHIDVGENTKIFTAKIIENEYFTVTDSQAKAVRIIFVIIVPIVIIAVCIFVCVRRRNAR